MEGIAYQWPVLGFLPPISMTFLSKSLDAVVYLKKITDFYPLMNKSCIIRQSYIEKTNWDIAYQLW